MIIYSTEGNAIFEDSSNTMKETVLNALRLSVDLSHANLSSVNLSETNFSDTDFTNANFSHANFSYADLSNADFTNANFTGANLICAKFTNANLTNANFNDAVLGDTSFFAAVGLKDYFSFTIGNQHCGYYFNNFVRIGCLNHSLKYWCKNYQRIGKKYDYSDKEIKQYGIILKTIKELFGDKN